VTIARWGLPTLLWSAAFLAAVCALFPPGPWRWGAIALAAALWCFTLAFFRNPRRVPAGAAACLVSPDDGVVADLEEVEEPEFVGGRCVRVGIFLSVFDVHVNRAPVDAEIAWAAYRPGGYLDARAADAGSANEANGLGLVTAGDAPPGHRLLVRQIAGLIARRIVCTHGRGDRLRRGELFGMIRMGSRTELWIPLTAAPELRVAVGDRVRGGATVIARISEDGADHGA